MRGALAQFAAQCALLDWHAHTVAGDHAWESVVFVEGVDAVASAPAPCCARVEMAIAGDVVTMRSCPIVGTDPVSPDPVSHCVPGLPP